MSKENIMDINHQFTKLDISDDLQSNIDNFGGFENKILLKRDITTANHPCADDLEVGELVFNAVTGRLYSKTIGGEVMMYSPSPLCVQESGGNIDSTFQYSLNISSGCENVCTNSAFGITMTAAKNNSLRFNPLNISDALPIAFNLRLTRPGQEPEQIARITAVADYNNAQFQFVYFYDNSYYPFNGFLKSGDYDNGDLGILTVESI